MRRAHFWLILIALCELRCAGQTYTANYLCYFGVAAVNDSGQAVGTRSNSNGQAFAVLCSGGQLIELGDLGGGESWAYGINDGGQVVGGSYTSGGAVHAFLYSGGSMTDLGTLPGGMDSGATGINNSGQVVGWADTATAQHAFLSTRGRMIDLGTLPGGGWSFANGINNHGQVAGWATTASGATHAFLYSGGSMIDLGALPGQTLSVATGVNDKGQVVGWSAAYGQNTHAFLYSGGSMIDLGALPGSYSEASGINNLGQVVGFSGDAFLYSGGRMLLLDNLVHLPGDILGTAPAINNVGQIVAQGELGAYLLTPGCPISDEDVRLDPGGPDGVYFNREGQPISMYASFTPTGTNGSPIGLDAYAMACGFTKFDWIQTVDHNLGGVWAHDNPQQDLMVPPLPPYDEPPLGGYTYEYDCEYEYPCGNRACYYPPGCDTTGLRNEWLSIFQPNFATAHPFYYSPEDVNAPRGCAQGGTYGFLGGCSIFITSDADAPDVHGNGALNFFDLPKNTTCTTEPCLEFTTQLVGICDAPSPVCNFAGQSVLLYRWTWESNYNGTTGGVTITGTNGECNDNTHQLCPASARRAAE